MRNIEEIKRLKEEANVAKERLIDIFYELKEVEGIREANSLKTIIIMLETWQNK